jgi:hypothetical protein
MTAKLLFKQVISSFLPGMGLKRELLTTVCLICSYELAFQACMKDQRAFLWHLIQNNLVGKQHVPEICSSSYT